MRLFQRFSLLVFVLSCMIGCSKECDKSKEESNRKVEYLMYSEEMRQVGVEPESYHAWTILNYGSDEEKAALIRKRHNMQVGHRVFHIEMETNDEQRTSN